MKKNVLATSIAALIGGLSLAGGASAAVIDTGATATVLEINGDGKGHILLVPYYNASQGMSTVINLVNSDLVNGKALKVRFRGANNSDDVFDFTLFLSPGDVWSGAVVNNNGSAALQTNDNSCVLPDNAGINSNTPINFVTSRLGADGTTNTKGALEGYVEVLNMADIPPPAATGNLYKATKHVNGVAPCFSNTTEYATLLTQLSVSPADAAAAAATGLANPTGGLFGNWTIINTSQVSSWGGGASAVEARDVAGGVAAPANIVFYPQINDAVLEPIAELTADPLLVQGQVVPRQYDLPDLSTPYLPANLGTPDVQADDLTGALAVTAVQNEYITSTSVVGSTDWVFSMPTRRYHVALDYNAAGPEYRVFRIAPHAPSTYFTAGNTSVDSSAARINAAGERSICVGLGSGAVNYRDRSEREPAPGGFVISPNQPAAGLSFCGEASVLSFNSTGSQVLGATIGQNNIALSAGFNSGWASINTNNGGAGFPILGSAFQKYLNKNGDTILGNFGSVYPHRYVRP